MFKLILLSKAYIIPANSYKNYTIPVTIPSGYTILGIMRYTTNFNGVIPFGLNFDNTNFIVSLVNIASTDVGNTFACQVLLVKKYYL